jgi:hypothetical protein
MRHSNHDARKRRPNGFAVAALALIVVGCGDAAVASPPPSAAPTPVVTPDPHLKAPVTADQLYSLLAQAKLGLVPNNANLGHGNPSIVKQINADLHSWPLRITQYRSAEALAKALDWKSGAPPRAGEAPYAFAGLNVLVQYGPINSKTPSKPEAAREEAAAQIVAILDPLLWPLTQHSVVVVPSRTPQPSPSPQPSSKPAKSAKPSKAP